MDRDAVILMVAERPFTRWSELTGKEQEAYEKKARRIREHIKRYEPAIPKRSASHYLPALARPAMYTGEQGDRSENQWKADAIVAYDS